MKIFITGASGFVGTAVLKGLPGNQFFAMSRSAESDALIRKLGAMPVRCQLGDVRKENLHGCAITIHCAAYVKQWGSKKDFRKNTIEGTRQLLEVARSSGVKRFLHISTEAALFAGQDMVEIDETYPYPKKQKFLYSWSKAEAEKLVIAANEKGKFETIVLRPRLVWGPGDKTVLPALLDMIKKNNFMWMDFGKYKTSTTHIHNFVEAIRLSLKKGLPGQIYFITDGEETSFHDFLSRLIATQGVTAPEKSISGKLARSMAALLEFVYRLFFISKEPPLTRFAAAIMSSECTIRIDKARQQLGYTPVVSVEQGLNTMPVL